MPSVGQKFAIEQLCSAVPRSFHRGYLSDETIAMLSDRFDKLLLSRFLAKHLTNCVDAFVEVVFLYEKIGPDLIDELVFGKQAATVSNKNDEGLERFFRKLAVFGTVGSRQGALADVETKPFEFKYLFFF